MKTRNCDAPKWLLEQEGITQRQWHATKRRELNAVLKAFDVFSSGCAFLPGYEAHRSIIGANLNQWRDKLRVKNWEKGKPAAPKEKQT